MNDKELLELSAKAADIVIVRSRLDDPMNEDFLVENGHRNEHQAAGPWNPLTDDGDALRLAVKLKLLSPELDPRIATAPLDSEYPYAATRRAIVRAAAEIGKTMK
jgi:hypothetical protein